MAFPSGTPAFPRSLGLHSHRHVALVQEGSLWPGSAAAVLEVGCVPGTTALHPCEDAALVVHHTERSRKKLVNDLVSGLVSI